MRNKISRENVRFFVNTNSINGGEEGGGWKGIISNII